MKEGHQGKDKGGGSDARKRTLLTPGGAGEAARREVVDDSPLHAAFALGVREMRKGERGVVIVRRAQDAQRSDGLQPWNRCP